MIFGLERSNAWKIDTQNPRRGITRYTTVSRAGLSPLLRPKSRAGMHRILES